MTPAQRAVVLVSCLMFLSSTAAFAAPAARPGGPLSTHPVPGEPAELAPLLRALRDTTSLKRTQAVSGISELKGADDLRARAIAQVALHDRDGDVRMWAAYELSRFPDSGPAILGLLAPAVTARDSILRANAAEPLGRVAENFADALPLLLNLANDPAPTVRTAAGGGLKQVLRTRPEQVPALVAAFRSSGPDLRFAVGEALIPAGVVAVPPMIERLSSSDWNERANAVRVLGQLGETDGRVAAALATCADDPDFRVREYALRALEALGTPAAHEALVKHSDGVETYGPVQKALDLHSYAEKPDSTIIVVSAIYREFRQPLETSQIGRTPPDITIAEEHRLYWCDFERGTVRRLARVAVPVEMRAEFRVAVEGWKAGTLSVGTYGMPAKHRFSPAYHSEARYYAVDPNGEFRRLAARAGSDYVPTYRDLPSGVRQFWYLRIDKDQIKMRLDDGPDRTIFHVEPATAELLPGAP